MAISYHHFGPCYVQTGTGAASALETVGVTVAGAEIELMSYVDFIKSDVGGPHVPVDLQDMAQVAVVRCPLVSYDATVLDKILKRSNSTTVGLAPAAGRIVRKNSHSYRLLLASATDNPWNFPCAYSINQFNQRPGTEHQKPQVQWFCWPDVAETALTLLDAVLFNRTQS